MEILEGTTLKAPQPSAIPTNDPTAPDHSNKNEEDTLFKELIVERLDDVVGRLATRCLSAAANMAQFGFDWGRCGVGV